jgi:3-dehydroquinate synthase
MGFMSHDKKAESGTIKYIVLQALGKASVLKVPDPMIRSVLQRFGAT